MKSGPNYEVYTQGSPIMEWDIHIQDKWYADLYNDLIFHEHKGLIYEVTERPNSYCELCEKKLPEEIEFIVQVMKL